MTSKISCYMPEKSECCFAVTKAEMPRSAGIDLKKIGGPEMSFLEFSNIISNDPRVLPAEETKAGFDYFGEFRLWHPYKVPKNSFGCAIVPRIAFPDGTWLESYAFGFQGFDQSREIYFSGLLGYKNSSKKEMFIFAAGKNKTSESLEETISEFFKKTNLLNHSLSDSEQRELSKGKDLVIKMLDVNKFIENGLYMHVALLGSNVLDGLNICEATYM